MSFHGGGKSDFHCDFLTDKYAPAGFKKKFDMFNNLLYIIKKS